MRCTSIKSPVRRAGIMLSHRSLTPLSASFHSVLFQATPTKSVIRFQAPHASHWLCEDSTTYILPFWFYTARHGLYSQGMYSVFQFMISCLVNWMNTAQVFHLFMVPNAFGFINIFKVKLHIVSCISVLDWLMAVWILIWNYIKHSELSWQDQLKSNILSPSDCYRDPK